MLVPEWVLGVEYRMSGPVVLYDRDRDTLPL